MSQNSGFPAKKRKRSGSAKFWGGLLVVTLGSFTLLLVSSVQSPNQDLTFTREVPSSLSPARLYRSISSPSRWSQWFYSLAGAQTQIEGSSDNAGPLQKGSIVKLHMNPGKGEWKKFDLTAEVLEYVPDQKIQLKVVQDSSGRLTRLFDRLEWKLELIPQNNGTIIRGTALAHTAHWRSRLFGRIAEKIVMNQLFYPDLVKLATLTQPFSAEPPPLPSQSSGW